MKRFIEGTSRTQGSLLPECLDDYVGEENPVRAIEAFVEQLKLKTLGFAGAKPCATGRPAYHPGTLLKIYIYGYLNRIQSSRRLERETQRNLELIWLTGHLAPDFKTIADFRKDNGTAIQRVCREFVLLCRNLDLFSEAIVAIDGSKFKAVNNRDKNFTDRKLQARMEQVEESIGRYLAELDRADREPAAVSEDRVSRLKEKIDRLKGQMEQLKAIGAQMEAAPDGQVSLTDPDARSVVTSGRGTGIVGYNVQVAVDTQHHLMVAHEVTNLGHDRTQLAPMSGLAKEAMGDKALTSNNKAAGFFDKQDFIYDVEKDEYRCPAGQRAVWRFTSVERGLTLHKYWSSACPQCPMKPQCTTSIYRRIARWEHEDIVERMLQRLADTPDASRIRRRTVEHVFGTLKAWMGSAHLLTKTLPRVRTEIGLHVLAYNLKRVMNILGVQPLIKAMAG